MSVSPLFWSVTGLHAAPLASAMPAGFTTPGPCILLPFRRPIANEDSEEHRGMNHSTGWTMGLVRRDGRVFCILTSPWRGQVQISGTSAESSSAPGFKISFSNNALRCLDSKTLRIATSASLHDSQVMVVGWTFMTSRCDLCDFLDGRTGRVLDTYEIRRHRKLPEVALLRVSCCANVCRTSSIAVAHLPQSRRGAYKRIAVAATEDKAEMHVPWRV
ncbi:hypothetical protein B0H14DRAFT_2628166 [Mycena olivaceomarginata]|nr:hypothetical protein B0H14DRAFT_2628166 [Mycena olivaceomarginata]